jgi:hypothetical protein
MAENDDTQKAAAAEAERVQAAERKIHVKMKKDGEKPLFVHPTCVAAHKALGWTEA